VTTVDLVDPLDLVDPERYGQRGYPHDVWTQLRAEAPVAYIEAPGFDAYVAQVRQALDQAGVDRAVVCGVSYGGLVAAAFAAAHPDRVAALVLASALPPSWRLNVYSRISLGLPP